MVQCTLGLAANGRYAVYSPNPRLKNNGRSLKTTMNQQIIENNNHKIAEIISDYVEIRTEQDALDWMATARYDGAESIIIYEHNLPAEFFDLKTKLAGDILQKTVMYRMKIAIVGDFSKYNSSSLQAFIRECNRGRQIFFVGNRETAVIKLTGAVRPHNFPLQ